mmetsp:Transcript_10707/g.16328  ORF Transcript_10707/g.16328 Transcript_10707/m.16328 type:complete len:319 (-) Transcript_10707:430-1386(-)
MERHRGVETRDNDRFADEEGEFDEEWKEYNESGNWGNLSTTDVVIAIVVLFLSGCGIVVLFFFVFRGDDRSSSMAVAVVGPTMAPTLTETARRDEGFRLIKSLSPEISFPDTPDGLLPPPSNTASTTSTTTASSSSTPQQRAAKWILWQDDTPVTSEFFLFRYALATIFYSTSGVDWYVNVNWLTPEDTCNWSGIVCSYGELIDIDLSDINMVGPIPPEIGLLYRVKIFRLMDNKLTGNIPYAHFAQVDDLTTLRLDNNPGLVGQLSLDLLKNGNMYQFTAGGTGLTGDVPLAYCYLPFLTVECTIINCGCCDANMCA